MTSELEQAKEIFNKAATNVGQDVTVDVRESDKFRLPFDVKVTKGTTKERFSVHKSELLDRDDPVRYATDILKEALIGI